LCSLQAIEKVGLSLPIVVRLEGTNAQQGLALLSGSKYNIYTEANLTQGKIPSAIKSQRTIPPKIFTKTPPTFASV
jgi:succinyl-CoA synthetase beta subunit